MTDRLLFSHWIIPICSHVEHINWMHFIHIPIRGEGGWAKLCGKSRFEWNGAAILKHESLFSEATNDNSNVHHLSI